MIMYHFLHIIKIIFIFSAGLLIVIFIGAFLKLLPMQYPWNVTLNYTTGEEENSNSPKSIAKSNSLTNQQHKEGTNTGQNKALHSKDLQSQQQEATEPQLSTEIGKAGHNTSSLHETTKKQQKSAPLGTEKTSQQDKALHELCNKTLNQPVGRYSTCK
ncbi:hypothetical protein MRB53_013781 [Persea americana]|uniref:Uncharacterized protein n=1 Tax=Persea americana TaxID=3435 RepID=A0ACC2K911_PERAE|nr:hypothetical protein MRB53_013781 [Persea americana]